MKIGDLVRIVNDADCDEDLIVNVPCSATTISEVIEVGLVVEDFDGFHHCIVLIGGKELNISKTRLEAVCK